MTAASNRGLEELVPLIVELTGKPGDPLGPQTHFAADLDMDSLSLVDLIGSVERRFSIEILDSEVLEIQTVGDLMRMISGKSPSEDRDK